MIRRNKVLQTITYNWAAKICALILALLLYLFGAYSNLDTRIVNIPVDVKLPTNVLAGSTLPSTVQVSIRGDDDVIYLVDPTYITATVDFSYVQGPGIAISSDKLGYNQEVFINGGITLEAEPSSFRVLFVEANGEGT